MTQHRYVRAYFEGKAAYPGPLVNPYAGELGTARMWLLGWQQARDEAHGIPPVDETLAVMAEQLADLAPLLDRMDEQG